MALLWGLLLLIFPVGSAVLAIMLKLQKEQILFVQAGFMAAALLPPLLMVLLKKWRLEQIGFGRLDRAGCKKVLYFAPMLLIFVPVALRGFALGTAPYVLGNLLLYLLVGIAEEITYRGIVPKLLKQAFSPTTVVWISTAIFGLSHSAAALSANSTAEILLTVLNAMLFGWMAIQTVELTGNITPMIVIHFLFDFETKIIAIQGSELLAAELARGTILTLIAVWLTIVRHRKQSTLSKGEIAV